MVNYIACPKCGYEMSITSYMDDDKRFEGKCYECEMEYDIRIVDELDVSI